jgi:hypothetical protein
VLAETIPHAAAIKLKDRVREVTRLGFSRNGRTLAYPVIACPHKITMTLAQLAHAFVTKIGPIWLKRFDLKVTISSEPECRERVPVLNEAISRKPGKI